MIFMDLLSSDAVKGRKESNKMTNTIAKPILLTNKAYNKIRISVKGWMPNSSSKISAETTLELGEKWFEVETNCLLLLSY